jgi:N-acetylglucosaminyl-diphospho-decaprenol L-rhamnosyltransferase
MACPKDESKSPAGPKPVSVVIVAYQSGETLRRCLAGLAAQTFRDFELVLVDNASSDGAPQAAAAADPSIDFVETGENLGFAAANNLAARRASGRWLVLLNPDAYCDPDWLERLLSAADRFPAVRSFTSRQLMAENPELLDGLGDVMSGAGLPYRGGYGRPAPTEVPIGEVFSPCGAAMMIDRALFLELGGFDESFFCYCEDVDLGYRLQLVDEPTLVVPEAVVRHEGSVSSGGPRSDFAVFHGTRNRFWLLVKNTPALLLPVVIPLHLLAVLVIMTRRFGRLQAPVTVRAMRAAFKGLGPVLKSRRTVQGLRRASTWTIAAAMTWNPNDIRQTRVVIRPWRGRRSDAA